MDFAQYVDSVESKLSKSAVAEALGEDLSVVKSALRQITAEHDSTRLDLKKANEESKGRKIKIRDELTPEIDDLKDQVTKLTEQSDTSKFTDELEGLRKFKTETIAKATDGFGTSFAAVIEHPNFEKARKVFNLPKADDKGDFIKDDSGNFDFSALDGPAMEANIAKMSELNALDYFGTSEGSTNNGDGGMTTRQDSSVSSKLSEAKTFAEIENAVP